MKIKSLLFFLYIINFLSYGLFAQGIGTKIIDSKNPIANIDVSYSQKNDNILIVTLLLNSKDNSQEVTSSSVSNSVHFNASLKGQINWTDSNNNSSIVSGRFLTSSPETPFKYITEVRDSEGVFIRGGWKSIENLKIIYTINGESGELPFMKIFPPSMETEATIEERILKINPIGKYTSDKSGEISIESIPQGTAFEVKSIDIERTIAESEIREIIRSSQLGENRYANNGKIDLKFKIPETSTMTLNNSDASYKIKVTGIVTNTRGTEIISQNTNVAFKDSEPLVVLNRSSSHSLVINNNDKISDSHIITKGKGSLGIEFVSNNYSKLIVVKDPIKIGNYDYTFELTGLNNVPDDSFSLFYYKNNDTNERVAGPYIISKTAPVLTNFKFIGVKNNEIKLEFDLPSYVDNESLMIDLGDLKVTGNKIISNKSINTGTHTKFIATLSSDVTNLVIGNDKITYDLNLNIIYNSKSVYSISVSLFNQKLLNDKLAELTAVTANRPKKREREDIKDIVNQIVTIGKSVGNSISEKEVTDAVNSLKTGDKKKIKDTMSDIGKWASIVGKIVLPILL